MDEDKLTKRIKKRKEIVLERRSNSEAGEKEK